MSRFIKALLNDGDGRADEQVLISLVGALVFFGLEIYSVVFRGQAFDPFGFGAGVGTLLGATSAGFGLRTRLTASASSGGNFSINPVTGRFMGDPNGDAF